MFPFYIDGPTGKLFLSLYRKSADSCDRSWIIFVPPFAEEMNRSRNIVARQARSLAENGYTVLIPDLYGTGDSEGDFSEADWYIWKADMRFLIQWAADQGAESISLWGLRTGCLLIADLVQNATESPLQNINRAVFWQPVLKGDVFLSQFLRLQVVAAAMEGDKITVTELMQRSQAGETLEVAGYGLNSALVSQLSERSLEGCMFPENIQVQWYEVSSAISNGLKPAATKLVELWQESGVSVSTHVVEGSAFWITQEVTLEHELQRTTSAGFVDEVMTKQMDLRPQEPDDSELPVVFNCAGEDMIGVLHQPNPGHGTVPAKAQGIGVLVVVGGPQYRVGSHRQFVLLARSLADAGYPVFRFDYRGMGDSSGAPLTFQEVNEDITSAVDCFRQQRPDITRVVVWGLCDAATASIFYARHDPRIAGMVLLNPWVYSEEGNARVLLKEYYLKRIFSRSFWRKFATGKFRVLESFTSFAKNLAGVSRMTGPRSGAGESGSTVLLEQRVHTDLEAYAGKVLLVLSGKDLTASQFKNVADAAPFQRLLKHERFTWRDMKNADHTFSSREQREEVTSITLSWLQSL